jgi:hypothetical protein
MIRNPFGGNAFGNGLSPSFQTPLPQPGFGQFSNVRGFYNGGAPFPGGNVFPAGGAVFPPRSFSPGPMGGQFGPGFGVPLAPGNGFVNQQIPFPFGQQQQPPWIDPNYFGSGVYDRPRSRHSSRHRSKSRHRRGSSSSSSDDERHRRGSPFAGPGIQYQNLQPFQNIPPLPPRAGSPNLPFQRPVW